MTWYERMGIGVLAYYVGVGIYHSHFRKRKG